MMMESVLDPVMHERLIADMEGVCETANVSAKFLKSSMLNVCSPKEIDWVKNFHKYREENVAGLVKIGGAAPLDRCSYMAAALLRNFLDARVMFKDECVNAMKEDKMPEPTILFIPNLFVITSGTTNAGWQIAHLLDLLMRRMVANKPTVVYIEDKNKMEMAYGSMFADHLMTHYQICEG